MLEKIGKVVKYNNFQYRICCLWPKNLGSIFNSLSNHLTVHGQNVRTVKSLFGEVSIQQNPVTAKCLYDDMSSRRKVPRRIAPRRIAPRQNVLRRKVWSRLRPAAEL